MPEMIDELVEKIFYVISLHRSPCSVNFILFWDWKQTGQTVHGARSKGLLLFGGDRGEANFPSPFSQVDFRLL